MYKTTYKCRMCGGEFAKTETDSKEKAAHALAQLCIYKESAYPIYNNAVHHCEDGSIGYADFVGFKREE